eukprot:scaffold29369_cov57-Cyclotella_meneghiniana.AAC.1
MAMADKKSIAGTNVVQKVFQAAHLSLKLIMLLLPLTIVMLPLFTGTLYVQTFVRYAIVAAIAMSSRDIRSD